jgi:hypothetical protein
VLEGAGLAGAAADGAATLWLVDSWAALESDALSTTDCSLSLRAQPNAANNRGDSPGTPGAPPAAEVRPSIRDTTVAITVDGDEGALCAAGVVSASTELACSAAVVLTGDPAWGADVVTGTDAAITGVLTTVCAATRMVAPACGASTFALGEVWVCTDELLWDNDGVVPVCLFGGVFAALLTTFTVGGLVVVGVELVPDDDPDDDVVGVEVVPVEGVVPVVEVVPVVPVVPVVVPVVVPAVEVVPVVPVVPVVDDVPLELVLPLELEDEEPVPLVLESPV